MTHHGDLAALLGGDPRRRERGHQAGEKQARREGLQLLVVKLLQERTQLVGNFQPPHGMSHMRAAWCVPGGAALMQDHK